MTRITRDNCVVCGAKIPSGEWYHDTYGNFCTACNVRAEHNIKLKPTWDQREQMVKNRREEVIKYNL